MQSRNDAPRRLPSRDSNETPPTSRLQSVRTGINQWFSGRSDNVSLPTSYTHIPTSPKTPRLPLGLGNLSSSRLQLPYLSRSNTTTSARPEHQPSVQSTRTSNSLRRETRRIPTNTSAPDVPPLPQGQNNQRRVQESSPRATRSRDDQRHRDRSGSSHAVGVGPEEQRLAELATEGRGRRRRRSKSSERMCYPKVKNQEIRNRLLTCVISGSFLTLVLGIYLALALSNPTQSQEFHVTLILIILITTIYFCHCLIRLCIQIIRPPEEQQRLPTMIGPGGFANPPVPIRIALARDEEAAGIESQATQMPPPAYGLWRESVRVDPNRIFWQRNEEPPPPIPKHKLLRRGLREEEPTTTTRPPSYASDNGVDYILEAEGRSIAPTVDVPLPVHPSERGRVRV